MLELRIHLPGEREPIRQLAFAKAPLLNLDGVFGRVCPVKFWYHHASMPQTPGAVFLQTPAGKLYCRRVVDGSLAEPAEVTLDNKIPVGGQFDIAVVKHLPRARREVTFTPLEFASDATNSAEAAALVELSLGQEQRQLWLSRGEGEYGVQSVLTPQGLVAVTFGYQQLPLGFTIALQDFVRQLQPGANGRRRLHQHRQIGRPIQRRGGVARNLAERTPDARQVQLLPVRFPGTPRERGSVRTHGDL